MEKRAKLSPGIRFYYLLPNWAKKQNEEIFVPLATVLTEIAINNTPATKENILKILKNLDNTDEVENIIVGLVVKHNNNLGKITWMEGV